MERHGALVASVLALVWSSGCSSSSSGQPADAPAPAPAAADAAAPDAGAEPAPIVAGVLVVGPLAGSLGASQAIHDPLAMGGQAAGAAVGDVHHSVLLGTTLMGTTLDQFLALDRWTNSTAQNAFYANPELEAGFMKLFAGPPSLTVYLAQPTWATYGTPDSADATNPHFWVVVRGKFKSTDLATDQATHDAIASQAAPLAKAAGDVAHTVWTGRDDTTEFLAIDVWPSSTNIQTFYSNPQLQAAFGMLLDGAPTIGVYQSTDWYQW